MKEKIGRFAKGIFSYELPEVILSDEQIDISVEMGKCCEGSFSIRNSKGTPIKGILYASSSYIKFSKTSFLETEAQITFEVDARFLNVQDGPLMDIIHIVTDCGEAQLPFSARITSPACETSLGSIRDTFHFANLAKSNWLEAQKVFKSDDFVRTLRFYDKSSWLLYYQLLRSGTTGRALEEYLIAAHKKVCISYEVDRTDIKYDAAQYSIMDKITITKDTWGYGELRVMTDVDFIEPERRIIWTEDFLSNNFELSFVINPEKLHAGKNYGHLIVKSVYRSITINIMAHKRRTDEGAHSRHMSSVKAAAKLSQAYFAFLSGKLSAAKCLQESEGIAPSLALTATSRTQYSLYKIYLQICAGKENAARTSLNIYKEDDEWRNKDIVLYGAVLFLEGLLKNDTHVTLELTSAIRELHNRQKKNLLLFMMLYQLEKRGRGNQQKKYDALKAQYERGCFSRLLYIEGLSLVCDDPMLLKEFDGFECQMLSFGLKHDMLNKNVILQMAYLAQRGHENGRLLQKLLMAAFERYKINELLEAICMLLIRSQNVDAKNHKWYRMAVNEQLKIAKLHEYCLYSAVGNLGASLPPQIFMYFAYDRDELNADARAFLYACLIKQRAKLEDVYANYELEIAAFARKQLEKGVVDKTHAVLYEDIYGGGEFDDETAQLLAQVVFKYEIVCRNENIKSVCVAHKELENESITELVDGKAIVDIFTEDYLIMFCAESGGRYCSTVEYSIERLVNGIDLTKYCCEGDVDDYRVVLNAMEKQNYERDDTYARLQIKAAGLDCLGPEFRLECEKQLIYYYYENIEGELLEAHLLKIDVESLSRQERITMIELMILRELYHLALTNIETYGFEGMDPKRLLKLCSRLIPVLEDDKYKDILVEICHCIFKKGKYDETVLGFLLKNYNGSTEAMHAVWQAAVNYGLDTTDIEERLLAQILFTENDVSYARNVFRRYYTHGCTHLLIKAFLTYYSFGYLRDERMLENEIFLVIKRELGYEENDICMLAYLKHLSGQKELSQEQASFVEYQLFVLEQKGLALPFFAKFKDSVRVPSRMYDKYYVEYYASPDKDVRIHYILDGESDTSFAVECMKHVCCGIFVREFVLFYGEQLQYYITEEGGSNSCITESREVRLEPELIGGDDTKYHQLNLIITAMEMNDNKTVLKMLESYIKNDYESSRLFAPID